MVALILLVFGVGALMINLSIIFLAPLGVEFNSSAIRQGRRVCHRRDNRF